MIDVGLTEKPAKATESFDAYDIKFDKYVNRVLDRPTHRRNYGSSNNYKPQ